MFALRSPLATPIGDSLKLDPRWDVFNHFEPPSVIILHSECLWSWNKVKIVTFNEMER